MLGVYFSGTGNTKYCIEFFFKAFNLPGKCFSIEQRKIAKEIKNHNCIVLAYPIYFSNVPKIMRDFIVDNKEALRGKKIFIIATMGLFSGDGAGCSSRLLKKFGAEIIGAVHIKMPDNVGDVKLLKKSKEKNQLTVKKAEEKIIRTIEMIRNNQSPKDGMSLLCHIAGLFGQRLWFYEKTIDYASGIKINNQSCIKCGKCIKECPMKNLFILKNEISEKDRCTMCYRCINSCEQKSITLLGKKVYEQCKLEKYL